MSTATLDYAVAGVLWMAVVIYGCFAGADFGGGVWDLLARGPRARAHRRAVTRAMGPVWEANHVWLIFMITGLFTAFAPAFVRLALALYLPFSLVVLGIVLRGASFAFRAHGAPARGAPSAWGTAFGIASAATPFLLGACAGAVASGRLPVSPQPTLPDLLASWTTPFALACGALALAICAGLAAIYLCVEESDLHEREVTEDFRRRALGAGLATLLLAIAALVLARLDAQRLWEGLTGRALPLMAVAVVCAALAAFAVYSRRYRLARLAAPAQVAAILTAWAIAQAPYLVPPDLAVETTASPPQTMELLAAVYVAGGIVLVPSLLLLFRVFKGQNPAATT